MKVGGLLILTVVFGLGDAAQGQECVPTCSDCVMGIWDEAALINNTGTIIPHTVKSVYLGMTTQLFGTVRAVEFSIAGLRDSGVILLHVELVHSTALQLGDIRAPRDTSATSSETGGAIYAFNTPWVDDGRPATFLRLDLVVLEAVENKVLRVKRKYPVSNPLYCGAPVFTLNDRPAFTAIRVSGGCYTLNPTSGACGTVTVTPTSWSALKQLYHTDLPPN